MRIRNLYNPPNMVDREPVLPWTPDDTTRSSKTTSEGCEITVTGTSTGWLYPPIPQPDNLAKVVWKKSDGSYAIGIESNDTIAILPGVTTFTRVCGYDDKKLVTMLQAVSLPLVFAASDHPY